MQNEPSKQVRSRQNAATIWDDSLANYYFAGQKVYWETLDRISEYQNQRITKKPSTDAFSYVLDLVKKHVGSHGLHGLSLGCSEEHAYEIQFMRSGYFAAIDVVDISSPLLRKMEQRCARAGIDEVHYLTADLNQADLGRGRYDFVWSVGTIHHIVELEAFFARIKRAMKKGGLFVFREYVGPNRLQFSARQLKVVNTLLSFIPRRYKKTPWGGYKFVESPFPVDQLPDPSEAVRSQDILGIFKANFANAHIIETGGTVLFPLLNGIAWNFETNVTADRILRLLIRIEEFFIKSKFLPSDYVFCIACKENE